MKKTIFSFALVALATMTVGQTTATQQYDTIFQEIDGKLMEFAILKTKILIGSYDSIPKGLTAQEAGALKNGEKKEIIKEGKSSFIFRKVIPTMISQVKEKSFYRWDGEKIASKKRSILSDPESNWTVFLVFLVFPFCLILLRGAIDGYKGVSVFKIIIFLAAMTISIVIGIVIGASSGVVVGLFSGLIIGGFVGIISAKFTGSILGERSGIASGAMIGMFAGAMAGLFTGLPIIMLAEIDLRSIIIEYSLYFVAMWAFSLLAHQIGARIQKTRKAVVEIIS